MSIITDILKEVPLSAVLKERLTQAEAQVTDLEKENASLKTENEKLRADLKKAHDEIERLKQVPSARQGIIPDDGFGSCRIDDQ